MTASRESAGVKALRYAEEKLKVHEVFDEAVEVRNKLDKLFDTLSEARDTKRALEHSITDVEMEVAADERSKHPEMSAAAMEKHMKVALHNNKTWKAHRANLVEVIGDIEGLEFDRAIMETDIKIAVSRMQELGGYLQYLAAIKQSEVASEASKALREERAQ